MTLTATIDVHRAALLRLVGMLLAGARFEAGKPAVLSRMLRATLLYSLRSAEAAARRLVFLKAYLLRKAGYTPKLRASRAKPEAPIPRGNGSRVPPFALFDPKKRFDRSGRRKYAKHAPRMFFFDGNDPVFEARPEEKAPSPEDLLDATSLHNRLLALKTALEDLSKQAKRMLRMQARREKANRPAGPLRRGKPPGHRDRGRWEVDEILNDCHQLAMNVLDAPDTG